MALAFIVIIAAIVLLVGMSVVVVGAAVGGLVIGVTESLGGRFLGEERGQIGISLIFILIVRL